MFNQKKLQQEEQIMNKFLNKYQRRHFFQYDTPMTISFLLTNKCNLRCKHCFNNTEKKMEDELNVEDYDNVKVTNVFLDKDSSKLINKKEGTYITIDFDDITDSDNYD